MKKRFSISLIVVASVVAAVLLTVLILGLIPIRPFRPFADYRTVVISSSAKDNWGELSDEHKKKFDEGLKKTKFSVLHATFEGVFRYGPRFEVHEETNADGKKTDVVTELTYAQMVERTGASGDRYALEFVYSAPRTLKVKKETVSYDRLRVLITSSNGEVHNVTLYPYLYDMTYGEGNAAVQEYRIKPVVVRANPSRLYIALGEIAADLNI